MKYILLALMLFTGDAFGAAVTRQFELSPNNGQKLVTVTGTSTKFLDVNHNRVYLLIQNLDASATLFVKLGSTISGSEGISIPANGGSVEYAVSPESSLWMKSSSGSISVVVIEGNAG